jgi:hypothetical protein
LKTYVHLKTGKNWYRNVQSSTIHNNPNVRATQISMIDEWINKRWCMHHLAEYYSAIKRNKVPIHATTCMNLETIMLSERSQHKRPYTV